MGPERTQKPVPSRHRFLNRRTPAEVFSPGRMARRWAAVASCLPVAGAARASIGAARPGSPQEGPARSRRDRHASGGAARGTQHRGRAKGGRTVVRSHPSDIFRWDLGLRRWEQRLLWAGHKLYAAPMTVRIAAIAATVLLVFTTINLVYQVLRKPAEIFVLVQDCRC
jgi:hypothetical protein